MPASMHFSPDARRLLLAASAFALGRRRLQRAAPAGPARACRGRRRRAGQARAPCGRRALPHRQRARRARLDPRRARPPRGRRRPARVRAPPSDRRHDDRAGQRPRLPRRDGARARRRRPSARAGRARQPPPAPLGDAARALPALGRRPRPRERADRALGVRRGAGPGDGLRRPALAHRASRLADDRRRARARRGGRAADRLLRVPEHEQADPAAARGVRVVQTAPPGREAAPRRGRRRALRRRPPAGASRARRGRRAGRLRAGGADVVTDGGVRRPRKPPLPDDGRDVGIGDPRPVTRQAAARVRRRLVRRAARRRGAEGAGGRVRGADDRGGARPRGRARGAAGSGGARVCGARAFAARLGRRVRPCARAGGRRRAGERRGALADRGGGARRRADRPVAARPRRRRRRTHRVTAFISERARATRPAAWVWLVAIVVVSAAVRIGLGHRIVTPWIMVDELIYSELAKSLASHGEFLVRGIPSNGYGFVYPAVIAPAFGLFASVPHAYAVAKGINAVVMSLAAVPTYFLARRLVAPAPALVAAALSVVIPSMLYTGMLMTENVFYPLFALAALLLVVTLERPTALRQLLLLAVCGIGFATRAQAIAIVPAVLVAPVLHGWIERDLKARLPRFATLYGVVGGLALIALAATAVRGRSPLSLLGAYRAATSSGYSLTGVLRYTLWHAAELDLYV